MNKTIIVTIKKKFEEEKQQLLDRLALLAGEKSTSSDDTTAPQWVDYGQKTDENAAEVAEYADSVSLQESLKKRVEEIDLALVSIEGKTYGTCAVCGKSIEDARLSAMPTATSCVSCSAKKT